MLKNVPKGDPGVIRALNKSTVLNHIRRLGPLSRTQIVELTGLSSAAASAVTAELIGEHILVERHIGKAGTSGGRRPVMLDINYEEHYAIGIKVAEGNSEAVLTDFALRVKRHRADRVAVDFPREATAQIGEICRSLVASAGVTLDRVAGVGIVIPGIVDPATGAILFASNLDWQGVPIAELVEAETGLPVYMDNDTNTFAVTEALFGLGKRYSDFIVVAVGNGVGAAFVLNGEAYKGIGGGAGEFGHNIIVADGRRCTCGRNGCLEAYTSEPSLIGQFVEQNPDRAGIGGPELAAIAAGDDPVAIGILSTAGTLLGRHIAYLVNSLNPQAVVLVGEATRLGRPFLDPLEATLRAEAFPSMIEGLSLIVTPWREEAFVPWARGAASLAIQRAFSFGADDRAGRTALATSENRSASGSAPR